MLHKKSFVKKTKAGNVVKVVREHYVRDDIASGIPGDPAAAGGGGDDDGAAAAAAGGAGAAAPTAPLLLSPDAPVYAVIDTNVALHQADVLEHPAVRDVVVCETVLREAEHRNRAAGARLRALCQPSSGKRFFVFANEHHRETYVERGSGETPNDYNDRAIRVAAAWYARRVREVAAMGAGAAAAAAAATAGGQRAAPRVVLVTDDAASRAAAQAEGALEAVGTLQFARMCADAAPDLADLVARGTGGGGGGEEDDDEAAMAVDGAGGSGGGGGRKPAAAGPGAAQRGTKRQRIFREHLSPEQVAAGLAAGRLHQGTLRASRFNAFEGRVAAASCKDGSGGGGGALGGEVLISGRQDMNRAFDGDVVVVELHPEAQWRRRVGGAGGGGGDRNEPSSAGERGGGGGGGAEEDDDDPDSRGDRGAFQVMGAAHFDGDDAAAAAEADGSEGGAADEWGPGASGARPTGRVVAIARRAWRPRGYAGSLDPRDVGLAPRTKGALIEPVGDGRTVAALFVPVERRFPKIRIRTRQAATLSDKRLVVAVDGWDADSPFPEGHYVRTLGPIGDLGTETEVLIHENDINTAPFSEAVHACVPPLPWAVDERRDLAAAAGGGGADAAAAAAAAAGRPPAPAREDLRHLDVCSVDPPGCVDIDDALHCRVISEAGKRPVVYEAGVHIADVAHFVLPGTALDAEAARRATTTYLVERRIDMLPKALTEEICSLR
jgi:exosome complex exonuclease DIS3/RRP44